MLIYQITKPSSHFHNPHQSHLDHSRHSTTATNVLPFTTMPWQRTETPSGPITGSTPKHPPNTLGTSTRPRCCYLSVTRQIPAIYTESPSLPRFKLSIIDWWISGKRAFIGHIPVSQVNWQATWNSLGGYLTTLRRGSIGLYRGCQTQWAKGR